mmetsp:Transcript_2300/g.3392  ORF Transcript_2300/g.3392 Transcript_2300/m.3392 type:complete len:405 (-) Transcript_2300:616-1830(-)
MARLLELRLERGGRLDSRPCFVSTGLVVRRTSRRTVCHVGIGFTAADFEILRQVGQQGYYEVTEWEYYERRDPTEPRRTIETSKPAIRLYDGKILSGPLRNTRVMLKEYLEPAYEIGIREAEVYEGLLDVENQRNIPISELLGSFCGDNTFQKPEFELAWRRSFPRAGDPPRKGSPWLVFTWEGNLTTAGFASFEQPVNFSDRFFPAKKVERRRRYLRKLMALALRAVAFLHSRGFIHRSLGPASLSVNTLDENLVNDLDLKIRDFGFGSSVSLLEDKEVKKAREHGASSPAEVSRYFFADDIYALGYAFMEIIFGSLSESGSGPQTTQEAFKRLFEDVYERNVANLREYISADENYREAVQFLDQDSFAGWNLISAMLSSLKDIDRQSAPMASELLDSSFLKL